MDRRDLDEIERFLTAVGKGNLVGYKGVAAEAAIHHQGRQLELSESVIAQRVEEILREIGGSRGASDADIGAESTSIDYYELLGVEQSASLEQIDAAYRSRYRWARSLKDLK